MSTIERNKGSLEYLFDFTEEECESFHFENKLEKKGSDFKESLLEYEYDLGWLMVVGDTVYEVKYEVERELDCDYFADVEVGEDGVIEFHTLHYNGGGSLSEIIESKLK